MDKVYIVESYYTITPFLQFPKIEGVFSSKELAEQYILNQEITAYCYKQEDNPYIYDLRPENLKMYWKLGRYKKSKTDTLVEIRKYIPTSSDGITYEYPVRMANNFLDYDKLNVYRVIIETIDKLV